MGRGGSGGGARLPKNSLTMAAEPLSVMMSLDAVLDAISPRPRSSSRRRFAFFALSLSPAVGAAGEELALGGRRKGSNGQRGGGWAMEWGREMGKLGSRVAFSKWIGRFGGCARGCLLKWTGPDRRPPTVVCGWVVGHCTGLRVRDCCCQKVSLFG